MISPEIKNLAKESFGFRAYSWMEHRLAAGELEWNPSWSPILRKANAGIWGFCAFEMPLMERFNREGIEYNEHDIFNPTSTVNNIVLREFTTTLISLGTFFAVGHISKNWLLASGAHLLTRFILNGVVHREMDLLMTAEPTN